MTDYTPTTEEVVCLYPANEAAHLLLDGTWHHMNKWEFDRWLAEVIRKAKYEAWDEGYVSSACDVITHSTPNPYRQGEE